MKYCFLMAVNRRQPYLSASIESVLEQTCKDFEFHIVANNCTEDFWEHLQEFRDSRIRLHRTSIGQLANSLNFGLDKIPAGYVLRIDADDICFPNRLEITKDVLSRNGYPDILAGSAEIIDGKDRVIGLNIINVRHEDLISILWLKNTIIHPACALNVQTIKKLQGYSGGFMSEDLDLWLRASRNKEIKFLGVATPLIKYRVHGDQARGKRLGYAESAAYRLREFIIRKNPLFLLGAVLDVFKAYVRGV